MKGNRYFSFGEAIIKGQLQEAMTLAASGLDVNSTHVMETRSILYTNDDTHTALFLAAYYGHDDIFDWLLTSRADVNHMSAHGFTPLMGAILGRRVDFAEKLILHQADVEAHSIHYRQTALSEAANTGNLSLVDLLIRNGASINPLPRQSVPLVCAAYKLDNHEVIAHLIKLGADINCTDTYGMTALQRAVDSWVDDQSRSSSWRQIRPAKHTDLEATDSIIKTLLENNADPNIPDNRGNTVLNSALGFPKLDQYLRRFGAYKAAKIGD